MDVKSFTTKQNKATGAAYSCEETIEMPSTGIYEAELMHDNIDDDTLLVTTGQNQSGTELTYSVVIPSSRPWARVIHVESTETYIYISYEYDGDEVEADDINDLQTEVVKCEKEINAINLEAFGSTSGYTWNRLAGVTDEES